MAEPVHVFDLSKPKRRRKTVMLDSDSQQALARLQRAMGTKANEAIQNSIRLADWMLALENDGAKLAVVKGREVQALQIRIDKRKPQTDAKANRPAAAASQPTHV